MMKKLESKERDNYNQEASLNNAFETFEKNTIIYLIV